MTTLFAIAALLPCLCSSFSFLYFMSYHLGILLPTTVPVTQKAFSEGLLSESTDNIEQRGQSLDSWDLGRK